MKKIKTQNMMTHKNILPNKKLEKANIYWKFENNFTSWRWLKWLKLLGEIISESTSVI